MLFLWVICGKGRDGVASCCGENSKIKINSSYVALLIEGYKKILKIIIHVNYFTPTNVDLMFNVDIMAMNSQEERPCTGKIFLRQLSKTFLFI